MCKISTNIYKHTSQQQILTENNVGLQLRTKPVMKKPLFAASAEKRKLSENNQHIENFNVERHM